MTLATMARYDGSRVRRTGDRAVVVGAGVAGLLAARVLADAYATVTVLDRDDLPSDPAARPGVPQGRHPHALLEAGRATVEDLLPGTVEAVLARGGVITDFGGDVRFYAEGGYLAGAPTRVETISASRPLFEHAVRERASGVDGVEVRPNAQFVECRLGDDGAVDGVVVREEGEQRSLDAAVVVDATGRTSRTPAWLEANGYDAPPVEEVRIDVAYSTGYVERPANDRRTFLLPAAAPRTRGGMAAPVEGGRWVVNLHGVHGETPPRDRESFAEFAATLPTSDVARIVEDHAWADDEIVPYRFPTNRRNRYEDLDTFPNGLVVVGDAVASFNPVYAQGMSVAALEALVLHHALAAGDGHLAARYFDRIAPVVDAAWSLAVGSDFGFAETEGPKPRGTVLLDWYLSRLLRRARTDGRLTEAFVRVLMMERPPQTLMRPGVLRRVFSPFGSDGRPGRPGRDRVSDRREGDDAPPSAT